MEVLHPAPPPPDPALRPPPVVIPPPDLEHGHAPGAPAPAAGSSSASPFCSLVGCYGAVILLSLTSQGHGKIQRLLPEEMAEEADHGHHHHDMVRQSPSTQACWEWSTSTSKPSSAPSAPSTTSLCLPAILAWEVTFSSPCSHFVCCQMQLKPPWQDMLACGFNRTSK